MGGFSSNLIFIFIALAIFIGRTIVEARKKKKPPPRKPERTIPPIHFEADKPAAPAKKARQTQAAQKLSQAKAALAPKEEVSLPSAAVSPKPPPAAAKNVAPVAAEQKVFSFNLNHLSPLKQAVVMAEILGPPKGME